jgi:hypothetical protein
MENNINVNNYKLYLKIDIEELKLYGKTIITLQILEPINELKINCKDLVIKHVWLNNNNIIFTEDKEDESLCINSNFSKGKYNINIEYEHKIGVSMDGLYYVKQDDSIIFCTHLEPIFARKVFPCFDSPHLKSTFDIIVESNKNKTFISNMNPIKEIINGQNKIVIFKRTPLMSTYLVCVVVGDIVKNEPIVINNNVLINGYYFNKTQNLMKESIKTTAKSIEYYEKIFDIKYKLPKMDIIAIPNFISGAMENWGLVTFRETGLMTDNIKNLLIILNSRETIFHEIAHQWFGNLVTLNSWNDIWLNESTATYFSWLGLIDNYPKLYPKQWYYLTEYRNAMLIDGFTSTHPISIEIKNSNNIINYFDEISYSKGSCLINYISNLMNRDNFLMGISEYLKIYSWKSTNPEDLYSILNKYSNVDISNLIYKFIKIKGYPLLTVTKINNKYKITKTKFTFIKEDEDFDIIFPLNIKNNDKIEIINIDKEIFLDYEPILNADNMFLCMINYENFAPNINLMSIPEIMHQIDCCYYLFLSNYKNFDYYSTLILNIFEQIEFKNNIKETLCLFMLIKKNLLNLNYILNSSNINNLFQEEFIYFINKIKNKLKDIFIHCIKNESYNIITISWINELIDFMVDFDEIYFINLCEKLFDDFYIIHEEKNFDDFLFYEVLFKTIIKYNSNNEIIEKVKYIISKTNNIYIKNAAIKSLAYSTDIEQLDNIMINIFKIVKLQDISGFVESISKNLLVQNKVIDWVFNDIKNNPDISHTNFSNIIKRITPNIYNIEILYKLKNLYIQQNNDSIFAIEIDKIKWHINIINNIIKH